MFRLKEYRKQSGLTQTELGKLVGVAKSTMSQYESGNREPDIETIKKFADIFGVTVGELLGHEEPEHDEAWGIRERLRTDPAYRMLFSAAEKASPDHLRAAAAMLKSLEPPED